MHRFLFTAFLIFVGYAHSAGQAPGEASNPKISKGLVRAMQLEDSGKTIRVKIQLMPPATEFRNEYSAHILDWDSVFSIVNMECSAAQIMQMAKKTEVIFIQTAKQKARFNAEVPGYDPTVSALLYAAQKFPEITGNNISIALKEEKPDPMDKDYSDRLLLSPLASERLNRHATEMATLLAGAGFSGWQATGAAPGALLVSHNVDGFMPEPNSFYVSHNIRVSNHSYGVGIENEYGIEATAFDSLALEVPELLFVFSSGNSGGDHADYGIYEGLDGWANITGNFKMSKNSLAIAAVDSFGKVSSLSSRGPAFDGRMKPEMAAFGHTGSSAAAALVSGTAARIAQWFIQQSMPYTSDLLKAILVAGTDENENAGPDFESGFGQLNAYEALKIASNSQFLQKTVSPRSSFQNEIDLPANNHLKIALTWLDPPAKPGSGKALINDIDLMVIDPAGDTIRPWVLNAFPHADSLSKPARRDTDTLNNIEVISFNSALSGKYRMVINSKNDTQHFALAWNFRPQNDFYFTNPLSTQAVAGHGTMIRWSTPMKNSGTFIFHDFTEGEKIEIKNNQALSQSGFLWRNDFQHTKMGRLEMKNPSGSFFSDTFYLHKPINARIGYACADGFELTWNAIDQADHYVVYGMGQPAADSLFITTDTSVHISWQQFPYAEFAVSPVFGNHAGQRSPFVKPEENGECYFNSLVALQEGESARLVLQLGSLSRVRKIIFLKALATKTDTLQVIENPATFLLNFMDNALLPGVNAYYAIVVLSDGTAIQTEPVKLHYAGHSKVYFYPNPVRRGNALQAINATDHELYLAIYDPSGRLVLKTLLPYFHNEIRLPQTAMPGIYFALAFDETQKKVYRLKLLYLP